MVVVELASKRSLVLFDAELMVRGGSAERETEDRVSFHSGRKEKRRRDPKKSPDLMTNGLISIETPRQENTRNDQPKCFSVYFQRSNVPKGITRYQDKSTDCASKTLATLSVNSLIYIRNVLITRQCLFGKKNKKN